MFDPSRSTINHAIFNRRVLECQDDAYTLAWYLSGNEALAETVVQAAVESLYRNAAIRDTSFRLMILQAVVRQSHRSMRRSLPINGKTGDQGILEMLRSLPEQERQALILVDILRLSYAESAAILRIPIEDLGQRLARARRVLAACQPEPLPSLFVQSHGKV